MNEKIKAVQTYIGKLFENEKKEVQMSSTWMPSMGEPWILYALQKKTRIEDHINCWILYRIYKQIHLDQK